MNERDPVNLSVLQVLESSRKALEQETTDRAQAIHEASHEQDMALTIGGMLVQECDALRGALIERRKFYANANWFQRVILGRSEPFSPPARSRTQPFSAAQLRSIRRQNVGTIKRCRIDGLLPTEPAETEAGPIAQDWIVSTDPPFFIHTAIRTFNTERHETIHTVPVHQISTFGAEASVTEHGIHLKEDEFFFPLGLIMQANQKVRASAPPRISKKW